MLLLRVRNYDSWVTSADERKASSIKTLGVVLATTLGGIFHLARKALDRFFRFR